MDFDGFAVAAIERLAAIAVAPANQSEMSVLVQGGDSAQRTVVDNAFLTERQSYLAAEPTWKQYHVSGNEGTRHLCRIYDQVR
jgi:hypothetical protein